MLGICDSDLLMVNSYQICSLQIMPWSLFSQMWQQGPLLSFSLYKILYYIRHKTKSIDLHNVVCALRGKKKRSAYSENGTRNRNTFTTHK